MLRLVKLWAQAHSINDAGAGTFNSHSLTLLVLFHLQTRPVAMLPPLKDLFDERVAVEGARCVTQEDIAEAGVRLRAWLEARPVNTESLGRLLRSFFALFGGLVGAWLYESGPSFLLPYVNSGGRWWEAATLGLYSYERFFYSSFTTRVRMIHALPFFSEQRAALGPCVDLGGAAQVQALAAAQHIHLFNRGAI